jgi:tRNA pseudouridine38-40 synthase
VQGELEDVISTIVQHPVSCVTAGRTDAGVHATGAVLHVDIPATDTNPNRKSDEWDIDNFAYRINRILNEDIRVISISPAPANFHARYSAISRSYEYKLADLSRPVSPLERLYVADWYRNLDLDVMNKASSMMLGEHDFSAFCKYREGATPIRTLTEFSWVRDSQGLLIASLTAESFGYNMVRNLVGAVVAVGEGRSDYDWILRVLTEKSRVSDSYVFPSKGLTLVTVRYPKESELLARAEAALEYFADRDEE